MLEILITDALLKDVRCYILQYIFEWWLGGSGGEIQSPDASVSVVLSEDGESGTTRSDGIVDVYQSMDRPAMMRC